MKKSTHSLVFILLLSGLSAFSQVKVDHSIQLTGAGTNARVSGIQDVSANQDAVSANYIQRDSLKFAMATGSNNAYAVTLNPAITGAYTVGMVVLFEATFANTGSATLNVNGLGAATIKKNYNSNLVANDILNGQMVSVMYDGTNFQMLSQLGNASASYWTLTGNNIYNNNNSGSGFVGVGTNGTPNTALDVNGAFATRSTTAASFSTGGSITVGNSSHIIINSGSNTNSAYTFSITNGQPGQYLTLEMAAGLYAQLPNSTLNGQKVQLSSTSAAFTPYSTLTLKWDGNYWVEIARSASTLSALPVTLNYPSAFNGKQVFICTGGPQTFTVPTGISNIFVKMWGAGGGYGGNGSGTGGAGAFVSGYLAVTSGQAITVIVGAGGVSGINISNSPTYGGGGASGNGNFNNVFGGSGGGRCALQTAAGADSVTAGGGGGGSSNYGGYGGATVGGNGGGGTTASGDGGGGSTTGGAAGVASGGINGNAGSQYQGGAGSKYSSSGAYYGSGGGGGGYYGGGGGGANSTTAYAGGGGSSYLGRLTTTTNIANTSGTATAANSGDGDYISGVGMGGSIYDASAGNGEVVIYW